MIRDRTPRGSAFGDCIEQPAAAYRRGETARAVFIGASPRNDLRTGRTFAAVEMLLLTPNVNVSNARWERVRDDSDWFLVVEWRRTSSWLRGYLQALLEWQIELDASPGTYRFRYYGDARSLSRRVRPFEGVSDSFMLT